MSSWHSTLTGLLLSIVVVAVWTIAAVSHPWNIQYGSMKRLLRWLLVLGLLGGIGAVTVPRVRSYWREKQRPKFRTAKVEQGPIRWEVRTTGKVEPVLKVIIGSFVSGPIIKLPVDFNDWVEEGQLLAKVDPQLYEAAVSQSEAAWATAKAQVLRVNADLQLAINDEKRAQKLREINYEYISDSEMDQYRFTRQAQEAQLAISEQSVAQAAATLENSRTNLEYTNIVAPVSGVVIDRKIDPGQTIAVQFQTPELFVIAPEMNERMWVHASVVEADIGHILQADKENRPVEFTVDAYEDLLFEGAIHQVRQNPTSDQNVVTYPVIVETRNEDLKLLPGMTANLSFEIDQRENAILIPGAAIRFLPEEKYVREEDKAILEGSQKEILASRSATDRVEANRRRRTRHVWIAEGDQLKAVEIEFGISDGRVYELVKGELKSGDELVTGVE